MKSGEVHLGKFWVGVVLFFATGAAIAMAVALILIERGASVGAAIFWGACSGGYGAYFVFYLILNGLRLAGFIERDEKQEENVRAGRP